MPNRIIIFHIFLSEHNLWTKGDLWVPQTWSSVNPLDHQKRYKSVPLQSAFTVHQTRQYHVGQISTDGDERPFLYDKNSKTWTLIDTGAQVNLWPKPASAVEDKSVILLGANKKRIPAYGIAYKMVTVRPEKTVQGRGVLC